MRIAAIMNPVAGASRQRGAIRRMLAQLEQRGCAVTVDRTTGGGDATRFAEAAVAARADAVVAIGGDGTVGEVVHGLAGSGVPLLIWPTGTENLVARSLGFRADADVLCSCFDEQNLRIFDLGVANGRSFMVVAGVGFDAEVVRRLTQLRRGHITHLSYFFPIWRTFWEHRFPILSVQTDALTWTGRGMVFVGNMARYALGLPVVRDAIPDDGLLDLLIMPCHDQVGLIGHSLRTLLKIHVGYKGVIYERVTWARVESTHRQVPVELDGDFAGTLPLEVRVVPNAIRVLVPPARSR